MIRLGVLCDEMRLVYAERRDAVANARTALHKGDRRAPFSEAECNKRAGRLPNLAAIGAGLAELERRRTEVPEWLLKAFEGRENG